MDRQLLEIPAVALRRYRELAVLLEGAGIAHVGEVFAGGTKAAVVAPARCVAALLVESPGQTCLHFGVELILVGQLGGRGAAPRLGAAFAADADAADRAVLGQGFAGRRVDALDHAGDCGTHRQFAVGGLQHADQVTWRDACAGVDFETGEGGRARRGDGDD